MNVLFGYMMSKRDLKPYLKAVSINEKMHMTKTREQTNVEKFKGEEVKSSQREWVDALLFKNKVLRNSKTNHSALMEGGRIKVVQARD